MDKRFQSEIPGPDAMTTEAVTPLTTLFPKTGKSPILHVGQWGLSGAVA